VHVAKVKVENVGGFHGARRVDLDLSRDRDAGLAGWTVFVGPNGCGKTTLLRAIALALGGPSGVGDAASLVSRGHDRGGVELDLVGPGGEELYVGLTLTRSGVEAETDAPRYPRPVFAFYGADRVFGEVPAGPLKDAPPALAGLASDLLRRLPSPSAPGIVIVDEIDAHLDLAWQQAVGDLLKERFPGVQFLVSTNSPFVCQAADPRGLVRLPAPQQEQAPYVVEDDLYRRVVFGGFEDAMLSELFGVESPYSGRARRLRRELVELELKVLDGQASEAQLARYRDLQDLLVSSPAARSLEIEARLAREKARRGTR
jgi:AAA domain/AAA domain, putative AbiEii toxin, Type IV TA system